MSGTISPVARNQLELDIGAILRDGSRPASPAPPPSVDAEAPPEPFGRWLLAQRDRGDWIDVLAAAARADTRFPKDGDPDDVRERLRLYGAEGDAFEQVDDAERCWSSL